MSPQEAAVAKLAPKELASQLDTAIDQISERLLKTEGKFRALGLGVTAWVDVSDEEDGNHCMKSELGFAKNGSLWRLMMRRSSTLDDGRPEELVLLKASKALRLQAAPHLSKLLDRMLDQAKVELNEAIKLASSLDAVLQRLDGIEPVNEPTTDSIDDEIPF